MPLKGAIQSASGKVPLYNKQKDVPEGTTRWALVSDSDFVKGQKALDQAAEDLGVAKERLTVFSTGREGDFWVVSAGYEVKS